MPRILIAHAPDEEARATLVAEKLAGLGYEVSQDDNAYRALSPMQRRKLAASISEAACVVVLWSREAADAPGLQAAAQAAKAAGKLAVARLDAAAPPTRMSGPDVANLAQWQGLDGAKGWRDLVESVSAKAKPGKKTVAPAAKKAASAPAPRAAAVTPKPAKEKKKGGAGGVILLLLLLIAAGGAAAYAYTQGLIPLG